jgi:peptidoglycan/LPS O-acetylase OafA/YrhL
MQSVLKHSEPHRGPGDTGLPACDESCARLKIGVARDDTRDLANLDILRTVAVSLVFADHLAAAANVRGLGDIGRLGVLIFFVHTSLVLMLSMERIGLTGVRLYAVFLLRRIFRIYPLSILAVVAVVVLRIPAVSGAGGFAWMGWPAFFSNVFLIQNLTHSQSVDFLWSLPFEMQMYLVLPALFVLLRRFPSIKSASLIWFLGTVVALGEWTFEHRNAGMDFAVTRYVPCFLAGVFAWRVMAARPRRLAGALWIVFLIVLVATYRAVDALRVYGPAAFGALHGAARTDHGIWWPRIFDPARDWAFCAVTGALLPFFREIRLGWFNGLSRRVALYSYGIYVAHVPAMWLCFDVLPTGSRIVGALLSIVLTGAVAVLLYHLLEHPAISSGKRLSATIFPVPALA